MLSAQRAIDIEGDFDKAAGKYRQALNLRPDDYRALWGVFLCESKAILYWQNRRGYVQIEGDIPENAQEAIRRYGNPAQLNAPDDVKPFYFRQIAEFKNKVGLGQPSATSGQKKNGCYIATAVYGNYDCPQVWVLRRYRDYNLYSKFWGRLFVKIYYAFSPTVVKILGKYEWFNKFWRKKLDKKVEKLLSLGYEDTQYYDIN